MFSVTSTQTMSILATYNPSGKIAIKASAIGEDLGNTFRTHIVEQKDPRFLYAIARAVTADIPNKNKDMFPLDEIKRAYTTFIGRNIFLDHNTTSVRNAVGKIIAAELREDEEGQTYVACLFKIDRELHPDIARKIENGIIDSVSMGANVQQTTCVFPQTKLFTPDGQRMIKDIHIGDYVLTHKGHFRQVTATFKNKCPETMVRVKYADGSDVKVLNIRRQRPYGSRLDLTGNHPVLMESGEWLPAKYLQPGDKVMCLVKGCLQCGKPLLYNYPRRNFCCKECKSAYILEQYPENIEKAKQRFKDYWRNLSVEQKEQIAQESAERAKSWWANLTPDEYAERCKVGHVALRKFFDTPSVKRDAEIERRIKFGKELFSNPENVEKASKRLKALYKNFAVNKRSKLEVKFENELISRGYTDFATNAYKCLNGKRMYPDFVFEDKKIIIEIDGEYWHNKEACKKKDQLHTKLMEEAGYTVLRFTGTQVIKYLSECVDTFERVYNNHAGNYRFAPMEVLSVETYKTTPRTNDVYNLSVEEDESYIAENLVVHNCSICSNIATREADFCQHQKAPSLYSNYYAINRGVEFTELSLVSVPADPSAKMHKVFDMHNGMQKVAVGEADLNIVPKSGEQPQQTVTKKDNTEIPVQPEEGRPAIDTIKVEQPEKPIEGSIYQIDCSSNESADFIYNILYPYLNKGIEELIITGRGIKVFFDEQVQDPESFIGEACSLFGLLVEKGLADQTAVASYNSYLKVQAATRSLEDMALIELNDNDKVVVKLSYSGHKNKDGSYNVTATVPSKFLGDYDVEDVKEKIANAFATTKDLIKSSYGIKRKSDDSITISLRFTKPITEDSLQKLATDETFTREMAELFTSIKYPESTNESNDSVTDTQQELFKGISPEDSESIKKDFQNPDRNLSTIFVHIAKKLQDENNNVVNFLKENKQLFSKLDNERYTNLLGYSFGRTLRRKLNAGELVNKNGDINVDTVADILHKAGITDKEDLEAYATYKKSTNIDGNTSAGKVINDIIANTSKYVEPLQNVTTPANTGEEAVVSNTEPREDNTANEPNNKPSETQETQENTDPATKKGKGNQSLRDFALGVDSEKTKPTGDSKKEEEETTSVHEQKAQNEETKNIDFNDLEAKEKALKELLDKSGFPFKTDIGKRIWETNKHIIARVSNQKELTDLCNLFLIQYTYGEGDPTIPEKEYANYGGGAESTENTGNTEQEQQQPVEQPVDQPENKPVEQKTQEQNPEAGAEQPEQPEQPVEQQPESGATEVSVPANEEAKQPANEFGADDANDQSLLTYAKNELKKILDEKSYEDLVSKLTGDTFKDAQAIISYYYDNSDALRKSGKSKEYLRFVDSFSEKKAEEEQEKEQNSILNSIKDLSPKDKSSVASFIKLAYNFLKKNGFKYTAVEDFKRRNNIKNAARAVDAVWDHIVKQHPELDPQFDNKEKTSLIQKQRKTPIYKALESMLLNAATPEQGFIDVYGYIKANKPYMNVEDSACVDRFIQDYSNELQTGYNAAITSKYNQALLGYENQINQEQANKQKDEINKEVQPDEGEEKSGAPSDQQPFEKADPRLDKIENVLKSLNDSGILSGKPQEAANILINTLDSLNVDAKVYLRKIKEHLKTYRGDDSIYDAAMTILANKQKTQEEQQTETGTGTDEQSVGTGGKTPENNEEAKQEAFDKAKQTAEEVDANQEKKVEEINGFDFGGWHVTITKFNDTTMEEVIQQLKTALDKLSKKDVDRVNKELENFAEQGPFFNENAKTQAELDTKFVEIEDQDTYFTLLFKKLDRKEYTVEGTFYYKDNTKSIAMSTGESFKEVVGTGYNTAMSVIRNFFRNFAENNKMNEADQHEQETDNKGGTPAGSDEQQQNNTGKQPQQTPGEEK